MVDLANKICILHECFAADKLPHAFGGALALAWCTERARGTIDIDVNLFLKIEDYLRVLKALPENVKITGKNRKTLRRDGQVRVWWETTPLDLFLNVTDYHDQVLQHIRWEEFAGKTIPFIGCSDLAVFKAFYNRTKDWADLEEMRLADTLDIQYVKNVIADMLGEDDERIEKLESLRFPG